MVRCSYYCPPFAVSGGKTRTLANLWPPPHENPGCPRGGENHRGTNLGSEECCDHLTLNVENIELYKFHRIVRIRASYLKHCSSSTFMPGPVMHSKPVIDCVQYRTFCCCVRFCLPLLFAAFSGLSFNRPFNRHNPCYAKSFCRTLS